MSAGANRFSCRGFSLIEMLTVIAIIGMLASFSALSLKGLSGASSLSTGGAILTNFLESARNQAIVNKAPVAVVLLASGDNVGSRMLTALQYVPGVNAGDTPSWARASKWEGLPKGVLVDTINSGTNNTFLPANSADFVTTLPNLTYNGTIYQPKSSTGYGYIVFLPDGSLFQSTSQPCVFRLVEGIATSDGPKYTGIKDANRPVDYFEVVINESTGRVKTARP